MDEITRYLNSLAITLEDCYETYCKDGKCTILADGTVYRFEEEI